MNFKTLCILFSIYLYTPFPVCVATQSGRGDHFTVCGGNIRSNNHITNSQTLHRQLCRIVSRTRLLSLQIGRTISSFNLPNGNQMDQMCIDDIFIVNASNSLPLTQTLLADLSQDYGNLFDMYSTLRLMQQDTLDRVYIQNFRVIQRLVKDMICAYNRALASFGDIRSRDVQVAPSIDSCGAVSFYQRSVRNRLLLDRMRQISNQLYEKYSIYKNLYRQSRRR